VQEALYVDDVDRSIEVHVLDNGQELRDNPLVGVLAVTRDGQRGHQGGQKHGRGIHFGVLR